MMTKTNPELLKVQLQIKRQLAYLEKCHQNTIVRFPNNKEAQESWSDMIEATKICLQIANGEDI